MTPPGGRFTAVNITTLQLIEWAYQLPPSRIAGATGWVASEHFDVEARAGGEVPPPRLRQMVRRLLADRFGLIVRNEQREVPAFTLVPNRSDSRPGPAYRCKLPLQNSLACACNAGGVRWMCWSSTASRVRRSTD